MSTRLVAADGPGGAALTPLDAARALLSAASAAARVVPCPVFEAAGQVLDEPLLAPGPVPALPVALRDGMAVLALDTVGAGPYAPAPLTMPPVAVRAGEALPPGRDAVMAPDGIAFEGPLAVALGVVAPGENVRRAGEDLRAGALIAPAGRPLSPLAAAVAAAAGVQTVRLRQWRLHVAAMRGDASASLLEALASGAGATLVRSPADADLVVVAGTQERGLETVAARGVALRPGGEAIALGTVAGRPAMAIPARPEVALAAWVGLAAPALAAATGSAPATTTALLGGKVASTVGLTDLVLLRKADADASRWEVLAVGDGPWSLLAGAGAAALIPPDSEGLPPGAPLAALLL